MENTQLEHRIAYRCLMVATRITRMLAPMWQDLYGLSVINWRVLAVVGRFEPLAAKDVVARTSTDPYYVSRAIEQLVELGMIRRGVDPQDRRRARLALTGQGRRAHEDIERAISRLEADLAADLSLSEQQALDNALDSMAHRATLLEATKTWHDYTE